MLTSPTGNTTSRAVRCNFKATNNESEYEALIAGLTLPHQMEAENIQVFSDSQLLGSKTVMTNLTSKYLKKKMKNLLRQTLFEIDSSLRKALRRKRESSDKSSKRIATQQPNTCSARSLFSDRVRAKARSLRRDRSSVPFGCYVETDRPFRSVAT